MCWAAGGGSPAFLHGRIEPWLTEEPSRCSLQLNVTPGLRPVTSMTISLVKKRSAQATSRLAKSLSNQYWFLTCDGQGLGGSAGGGGNSPDLATTKENRQC